jgi:pimeloyl-ACP methyl ester carboxylesterase
MTQSTIRTGLSTGQLWVGDARLVYQTIGGTHLTGGHALPLIFQHGMGGDTKQPLGYIGGTPPAPIVALNARGHAPSSDLDPIAASFDTFADDVIAVADQLDIGRFVIGGISLGAGTALNLTVRYPGRVAGLVLCRPAWLDRPQAEFNRNAYAEIADLLDRMPTDAAVDYYRETRTYRSVQAVSPAAAASLLGQIVRPRAAENADLLRTFPAISPTTSTATWEAVDAPTLVIGHDDDPFHPYEIAQAYADTIPDALLRTVPSKDADPAGFTTNIRAALNDFLHHR